MRFGRVINSKIIPGFKATHIAGAADNQLGTTTDAAALRKSCILYASEYVINSGKVISGLLAN